MSQQIRLLALNLMTKASKHKYALELPSSHPIRRQQQGPAGKLNRWTNMVSPLSFNRSMLLFVFGIFLQDYKAFQNRRQWNVSGTTNKTF